MGKYTKKDTINIVLSCKNLTEFQRKFSGAHKSAKRNGWLDEVCTYLPVPPKKRNYWTYERCKEEITKMTYLKDLQGTSVLNVLNKNGWYDELTSNLIRKSKKFWTKDEISERSIKYKHKVEFIKNENAAYLYAQRRGWLGEVCSHMIMKSGLRLGESCWTKERIKEEALKFNTRTEFNRGKVIGSNEINYKAKYAYSIAAKNGWLDEVCVHMKININKHSRYIYAYIWEDVKEVYIGLTQDCKTRFNQHKKNKTGIVYLNTLKRGEPKIKILTSKPVLVKNAPKHEEKWKLKYEDLGYKTINVAKTGSLGSYSRIWDYEKVKQEALKYNKRTDFHLNGGGAVVWAKKNKCLEDVCSHMELIIGKWDIFENVQAEALKYKTRKEFKKGCKSASDAAYRNKWMDILYPKDQLKIGDMGYWMIKENVMAAALKCKTKTQFSEEYHGAYNSAKRNGWFEEACSHMDVLVNKWDNIEDIKTEARKYKTKTEFAKGSSAAYSMAKKRGWYKEICSIFPKIKTKWSCYDDVKKEALKYNTRGEFNEKNGSAYNSAISNGWLDEICSHMNTKTTYPPGHWMNKENVLKASLLCKTKKEFRETYKGAYGSAQRNGWLNELTFGSMNIIV